MTRNKIRVICIVMVLTMATLIGVAAADGTMEAREIQQQSGITIDIVQNEQERSRTDVLSLADTNMQPFSQNDLLYPAIYAEGYKWTEDDSTGLWTCIENARDKIVTVTNLSNCSVYFRTVIALEANQTDFDNLIKMNLNRADYDWNQSAEGNSLAIIENVPITYNYDPYPTNDIVETATVTGVFDIIVGTYIKKDDDLVAGELVMSSISTPSLLQVAMHRDAQKPQIQQFGNNYEILVTSQAVPVNDKDAVTAISEVFGTISEEHHPWKNTSNVGTESTTSAESDEEDNTSTIVEE